MGALPAALPVRQSTKSPGLEQIHLAARVSSLWSKFQRRLGLDGRPATWRVVDRLLAMEEPPDFQQFLLFMNGWRRSFQSTARQVDDGFFASVESLISDGCVCESSNLAKEPVAAASE